MDYFPELVLDGQQDVGEHFRQVNYAGFGVLAIKAIPEQAIADTITRRLTGVPSTMIAKQVSAMAALQVQ